MTTTIIAVKLNGKVIAYPITEESAKEIESGNPGSVIVAMTQSNVNEEFERRQTNGID